MQRIIFGANRKDNDMWQYLAAAVAPYAIDAITGQSKKMKDAQDKRNNIANGILTQMQSDIGGSASDSLAFKTAKSQLDRSYAKTSGANLQTAAAQGLSSEAQLGQTAELNNSYMTATTSALADAEAKREALKQQYRQLLLGEADNDVAMQSGNFQAQNSLATQLASLIPEISGSTEKKKKKTASIETE
jgi:hypothetical protein